MSRIYGAHAVGELLTSAPEAVTAVLVAEGSDIEPGLLKRAQAVGVPVRTVPSDQMRQRSGGRGGARIGADLKVAPCPGIEALRGTPGVSSVILALDGVTDPHNLGAILRSAAAFGVDAVVVPRDRSAPLNDAAIRASAGAVAHVPLERVTNLARTLRQLKDQGYWVLGADAGQGQDLWRADLTGPIVFVLGAEGSGLRQGVAKACDLRINLPMPGKVTSLNVSVFAGVLCAEAHRSALAKGAS
ncbi:MAG: 23S rRNA (guanosine(2251)-2'-O)-methyltransferase RlmB [Myxococcota bacterium]|nr:23S rRNA (guanosine(2251)-2'-O)-methyltransferase RlmB [Myxococcota bacterium]